MVRKLAIRSLRRGIGSMDYIETLLIMEDDLDDNGESLGESSYTGNHFNMDEHGLEPSSELSTPNHRRIPPMGQCQIGANVGNVDQCRKKLKTNVVS